MRLAGSLEERLPRIAAPLIVASRLAWLLRQEIFRRPPLPWAQRLHAWRRGFLSYSWIVGDLERCDPREHVGDLAAVLAASVNGPRRHLLNDKILFGELMARFPGLVPALYAVVLGGRLCPVPGSDGVSDLPSLAALLQRRGPSILKPAYSSCGHGVWLLEHDGTRFRLDRRPVEWGRITRLLAVSDRHLIQERVEQHAYAAALFPDTANTLRVLTMWDFLAQEPFLASVVQRIGTAASFPVDNTARGGLWCPVDLRTGAIGPAIRLDRRRGRREVLRAHPDTGAVIEGSVVPDFGRLQEKLLAVARQMPFLPYVGWDVLVTADGLRILEGNNAPELSHTGPLLRDERVRRFLARHRLPTPLASGQRRPAGAEPA